MCVTCTYQITQFYLRKSPYFYFRFLLSVATTFSRFATCFCPAEQFPCVSGADFCIVLLTSHPFLTLPSLPTCQVCSEKFPTSPHDTSLGCGPELPYISGQVTAPSRDPCFTEQMATVFLQILKKTGKPCFLTWEKGQQTSSQWTVEGANVLRSAPPFSPSGKTG